MQAVELFVGAGGLALGVSEAGFHTKLAIEKDKYCCDTIKENSRRDIKPVKNWRLFEDDIKEASFERFKGRLHLISGGPPCQPFSIGGRHRANADTRDMFPEAVRAVREAAPKAFLFENVKGLTRQTFASYFEYIKLQLTYPTLVRARDEDWIGHFSRLEQHHTQTKEDDLQYNVVCRVLNAANFGVPQRRERVFFVGFRADLDVEWSFPEPTHSYDALLWDQRFGSYRDRHGISSSVKLYSQRVHSRVEKLDHRPEEKPWRTVRDAIADLPDPETSSSSSSEYLNHKFQPGARSYVGHTGSPLDEPAKTLRA